eukprot:gene3900-4154_t
MTLVVRDNLEPDVRFWKQHGSKFTFHALLEETQSNYNIKNFPNTARVIRIRNNTLSFLGLPADYPQGDCDQRVAVAELGMTFPDVVFVLNVNDAQLCEKRPREDDSHQMQSSCKAPVISISKTSRHADILAPVLLEGDAEVVQRTLPWELKADKAFFRGAPSCGQMPFPPTCARTWVARLAQTKYSNILDAGIIVAYDRPDQVEWDPVLRDGQGKLPVLPRVEMNNLPKYKWLLNLDGWTAAYRLAQLLAVNSLVFKQESARLEFYYRSLKPFQHYVPILKESEHDLIPRVQWAQQHEHHEVQDIVRRANEFAMKYTTWKARMLYLKYVLLAYKQLFNGTDSDVLDPTAALQVKV